MFVDFERDRPGQSFLGAGLSIPIPVWRRQQGELAVAHAERARLEDERALAAREVALEVERAYRAAEANAAAVGLLERDALPAADAVVKLLTDGWSAGKFDLFRVLQTTRDASVARRLYLETMGALWDATIALDRAVGGARMTRGAKVAVAVVVGAGLVVGLGSWRLGRSTPSQPPAEGRAGRPPERPGTHRNAGGRGREEPDRGRDGASPRGSPATCI